MKHFLVIALILMLSLLAEAETYVYANTYGAPLLAVDAQGAGMGGAGSANTDGTNNILTNPASLAYLKYSRLVLNMTRLRSDYTTDKGHGVYNDYTLPWFCLNMATSNDYGLATGYSEEYEGNFQAWGDLYDGDAVVGRREVWGKGVVAGYWISGGLKLSPALALGTRAIYYYGDIRQFWNLLFERKDYHYSHYMLNSQRQGPSADVGLIWQARPDLGLGLAIKAPAYLSATDVDYISALEYHRENNRITYPPSATLGATWNAAERTSFSLDLGYTLWSMARYTIANPPQVRNALSIRSGTQWYPLPPSANILSNVAIRGGLYYAQGYPAAADQRFNEMGLTAGTGYRFSENEDSMIDLAAAFALRDGQSSANEKLFRVWLSLVGIENWFLPPPEEE